MRAESGGYRRCGEGDCLIGSRQSLFVGRPVANHYRPFFIDNKLEEKQIVRAALKELMSPDVDLRTYQPEDEEEFGFLLEATIGPDDVEGGDLFQIFVCSPKWLMKNHKRDDLIFCQHRLIAFECNLRRIEQRIADYCSTCVGKDWMEVVVQLQRIGEWEFENYKEHEP